MWEPSWVRADSAPSGSSHTLTHSLTAALPACRLPSCAVVMVCLLRYAQVIEHSRRCWVNTSALVSGCTNAVGLVMVGNFQVSVTTLHSGCVLQAVVTARTARSREDPACIAVKQQQ